MRPEYSGFTQALQPRNPQSIRPKRQNLPQLLRLIEELYSHRFSMKTQSGETRALHESSIDFFVGKYASKKLMVD